jgi:hypothetical protein
MSKRERESSGGMVLESRACRAEAIAKAGAAKFHRKPIQILFVRLDHDRFHSLEMFAGLEPLTPAQPRLVFPFLCQRDKKLKVMPGIRVTDHNPLRLDEFLHYILVFVISAVRAVQG